MIGGGEQTEIVHAPTVARLANRLAQRPAWEADRPLAVDPETYAIAESEMTELQRRRGFPLARAAIRQDNFLILGVPVVIG